MMTLFKKNFTRRLILVLPMLLIMMSVPVFAGNLWENANRLINDIQGKLLGFSTAAACIGVTTGALMKKFSMGKQDKVELGGKVMKDSIWGWAAANGATLVLNYLTDFMK